MKKKELKNKTKSEVEKLLVEPEFIALKELYSIRQKTGRSQAEISQLMEIQQSSLCRIESALVTGVHAPSIVTLKKYADALGFRIDIKLLPK
jgi:transcriptional regulator with XRE-family HTH domain